MAAISERTLEKSSRVAISLSLTSCTLFISAAIFILFIKSAIASGSTDSDANNLYISSMGLKGAPSITAPLRLELTNSILGSAVMRFSSPSFIKEKLSSVVLYVPFTFSTFLGASWTVLSVVSAAKCSIPSA
ncbi:hypothetical protein D1872_284930 [compost metagenome]